LGTARSLVWNGPGADWDLNVNANFLDPVNPTAFNYGDSISFPAGGSPSGVVLTGKYLTASSVTVDGNYAFTGTGSFAGPGNLICRDSTFLDLGNANTYSGGTLISNASASVLVYLRNYNALGTGPVTLARPGTIQIIPTGAATTGINGDLVVKDDFTIQVDGMGTFGAVLLGNFSGTASKILTLNGNPSNVATNQRVRVYGTNTTYNGDLVLNSALLTLAPYHANGVQTYNGVISGAGSIIQRGNGVTVLAGQNTYSGGTTPTAGAIAFGSDDNGSVGSIGSGPLLLAPETTGATGTGLVLASGGARTIANPIQNQNGTNNLTLIIGGVNDLTFSGQYTLNGNDNLLGTFSNRTIQVTNTALTTISGVISDGGQAWGLIKTGPGILALSNTETYTGPTAVSNGLLRVNGSLAAASTVTVATNATLGGTGTIGGNVSVVAGGVLAPGNSIGTLTIGGNLTLAGNLGIEVNRSGLASDKAIVTGTLSNSGAGIISVTNLGAALQVGDVFTLFNKAVTGGNTMTITGANVTWTNKLALNGTIEVVPSIPTAPTNLTFAVAGNTLTVSWPASYLGWSLQSNAVSLSSTSSWFVVPGSTATTSMNFTANPTKTNVFYRMVLP
jgi:fibronectin-binding autotransporter adhesin